MTSQINNIKHLYVHDHLENRFSDLLKNSNHIVFATDVAKMHPYYKAFFLSDGTPAVQKVGFTGAKHHTILTEKELDELALIPEEARVHYLLSL